MTPAHVNQVRRLLAEHFGNPRRRAAREARACYLRELISATARGEDTDREAADWLARLRQLCGEHAAVEDIARWYEREQQRLRRLVGE
jgi:hypothetical protein